MDQFDQEHIGKEICDYFDNQPKLYEEVLRDGGREYAFQEATESLDTFAAELGKKYGQTKNDILISAHQILEERRTGSSLNDLRVRQLQLDREIISYLEKAPDMAISLQDDDNLAFPQNVINLLAEKCKLDPEDVDCRANEMIMEFDTSRIRLLQLEKEQLVDMILDLYDDTSDIQDEINEITGLLEHAVSKARRWSKKYEYRDKDPMQFRPTLPQD